MKTYDSQRINTYMVITRGQAKAAGANGSTSSLSK